MHNQSDYGYAIPAIEARSASLCWGRAMWCRAEAKKTRGTKWEKTFWEFARGWLKEYRIYRDWEARQAHAHGRNRCIH